MKKVLLALTVLAMLCGHANAVTLFWDGDGAGTQDGGAGLWNTTNLRWGADEGLAASMIAWPNLAADTAVFDDVAGAVTIGGALNVGIIRTTIGGYSIGNGNGVGGAANTINSPTYDATHTTLTTSITALNAGTVTKTGPGRVEINNTANPSTTKWVLKAGALTAPAPSRFGTNPATLQTNFFTFDGGGFGGNTTTAYNFLTNQGVTITANGAFFGATTNTVVMNFTAPIDAKGDITINGGAAQFTGSAHTSGGILMLSNAANAWTGAAGGGTINISGNSGSGLRLGASNVIPDQYTVNLTVAGTFMDMATNSASDTIKAVKGTAGTVQVGTATLTIADGNDAGGLASTYSSVFTSTATTAKVVKNGAGTQILSGGSSGFSGEMELNAGKFGVGSTGAFGSAVGAQLTLKGGTLSNTNATGRSMSANLSVNISGDFTVDDSIAQLTPVDGGVITFNGTNTIRGGNRTITVSATGGNLSLLTIATAVGEDAAGRGIVKNGNATLALNAVNTYSGNTTINAGTINIDGDGTLGNGAGTLGLAGGRLNTTADRTAGTDPVANPLNLTASSAVTTTSTSTVGASKTLNFTNNSISGSAGTLTFRNDGTGATNNAVFDPRFTGSGFNFTQPIVLDNGAGTGGQTTRLNSYNGTGTIQTFSGAISGNGSYNRSASAVGTGGKTIMTGTNTYSGETIVNRGTLQVDGNNNGTGLVTVNADGRLGGNGTIAGNVLLAGGTLAPGASIGTLGIGGNLTLTSGTFEWEFNSTALTADLDNVSGALAIASAVSLVVAPDFGASFLTAGTKFTVISYFSGAPPGTFAGLGEGAEFSMGGKKWRIKYADSAGLNGGSFPTAGHNVTLTAIPEASSILVMGLGGIFAIGAVWLGKRYGITIKV